MDNTNPYAAPTTSLKLEEDSPKAEIRHAGFWLRVVASIIDGIVLQIGIIIIAVVFGLLAGLGAVAIGIFTSEEAQLIVELLANLLSIVINWLYFTLLESSSWQATLGKKALGIKVTDEQGNRIGFGRANGRYWSKILSALILGIGFLMVAFTQRKQGLHDIIAGTLVIKK
ncbi:MAG: RDD family protein [Candidatus Parabeggiatoa sp. nov. 2]|nr:MAG: hypothetical protein B6247_14150 [Beggiatoa sp. 4572_84]RKZ60416.1 MAG: RDD family protein [Gammaproteobacteria bacterium]HEC84255.1 RDD family protein [Thioploca sp.]